MSQKNKKNKSRTSRQTGEQTRRFVLNVVGKNKFALAKKVSETVINESKCGKEM